MWTNQTYRSTWQTCKIRTESFLLVRQIGTATRGTRVWVRVGDDERNPQIQQHNENTRTNATTRGERGHMPAVSIVVQVLHRILVRGEAALRHTARRIVVILSQTFDLRSEVSHAKASVPGQDHV